MTDEFEIIDAHVHLYRNLSLEKRNVVHPGRRDRDRWGNPDAAIPFMDNQGISKIVCLPNYPTRQMRQARLAQLPEGLAGDSRDLAEEEIEAELKEALRRHNQWICALGRENERFVPAISIQKVFSPAEMVAEVEMRAGEGAKIVKLLPGMYFESPDDRAFWPLYEACQDLDIAVVSDTGTLGFRESGICYGEPIRFTDVLESFPRLRLVMAHFASAFWDQRLSMSKRYENLFFDTSGSFYQEGIEVRDGVRALHSDDAVRIIREVGTERFMFGSDGPRFLFQPELEQVLALELSATELSGILAGNARRIYRI